VALLPEPPSDSSVRDEVTHWFFDDYLTTWIGVGAGTIKRGPEFILDYWSAPLHWSDHQINRWYLDAPSVVSVLEQLQNRLRAAGYVHTAVPDWRVRAYHIDGAAIEVIWSRQRADGTEIEKLAAHFEVARGPQGWRIVSIQAVPATSDSLKVVWPQSF
jgi:hypothetical protein